MADDDSIRPVLVPESEWGEGDEAGSWGWKGSENAGWNDEEYSDFGDDGNDNCCDDDAPLPPLTSYVDTSGSSSKWKPGEFESIFEAVAPTFGQEGSLGLIDGDDNVVMRVNDDQAIVFSIDWFTPVVDDYYQFGAISAASALSGLYATGAKPITALNVMALPRKLGVDIVGDVVRGGSDKVIEAGAFVVGGHSIDDNTPKYGLAAFGLAPVDKIIRNERVVAGDVLFYTKPLGSGVITEAYRAELETEETIQDAVASMLELNKAAADAMVGLDVHGATRVAEQGLVGHAHVLLEACGAAAELSWGELQLLDRVWEHCLAGCIPARALEVAAWARGFVEMEGLSEAIVFDGAADPSEADIRLSILCDPQTSGGLVVALSADQADAFVAAFEKEAGRKPARIGRVVEGEPGTIRVRV